MMNHKVKLFALSIIFCELNSCTPKCDHSDFTKNPTVEELVLKEKSIIFSNKPKNIIFMIGDGMGLSQITAGNSRNKDFLNLARIKHIGFSKTNSASSYITDSAAGSTAFSIGKKNI